MWPLILPHLFLLTMTILSTAYFPSISWMALFSQRKELSLDLWETYPKQSYRNRCHIATSHGLMSLSVPVKKPQGNQTKTQDIAIDYQQKWQSLHWKSIQTAYQSTPFFLYYQDEIEELIKEEYADLKTMNERIILKMADLMGIQSQLKLTDDFIAIENDEADFRFSIHPKKASPFQIIPYYQVFDEQLGFLEDLSSLDLLFNLGPESIAYLESLSLRNMLDNGINEQ